MESMLEKWWYLVQFLTGIHALLDVFVLGKEDFVAATDFLKYFAAGRFIPVTTWPMRCCALGSS